MEAYLHGISTHKVDDLVNARQRYMDLEIHD